MNSTESHIPSPASAGDIQELFRQYVVPSYGRFDLTMSHGQGSWLWDASGRRYLDLGSGIAVCTLGHAHPEITDALAEQSRKLVHISNLYYHEPQGRLAERLVKHLAPDNFAGRLLVRPDLIQRAQQYHFRPFNGHHVQIPITDGRGNLTREFQEWLPFAETLL